jgi:hypothetical protein
LRLWKLPDQVLRLGILFVIAIAALVIARQRFVPESFGELGHYRADAIGEAAEQPIRFAGAEACADCHDDVVDVKGQSYHRGLSCEVCHGPGAAHVETAGEQSPVVPRERAACLYCHGYLPSRPTGFPQIIEKAHNPMEPCLGCHNPHDPTPPHVPESCSACHGQIARTKAVSPHRTLNCETCHTADERHRESPRSYLPSKPTRKEFCGTCHAPGATSPKSIPRVEIEAHGGRYLCWQCHYPHHPEAG